MDQAALRAVLGERDRSLGIAGTAVREGDHVFDASQRRGAGRRRRGAGRRRRGAGRRQRDGRRGRAGRRGRGGGHGTKWRRASKLHGISFVNDHGAPVDVHLPVHLHVTQGYAAGPGARGLQLCVLWRCGAQPEGRTAATPRHGPWWPSRSLLSELACREVGHSVAEQGHALVVCGVERSFRSAYLVPGWSKCTSLGECDQSAAAASLWQSRVEGLSLPWPRQPGASDRAS